MRYDQSSDDLQNMLIEVLDVIGNDQGKFDDVAAVINMLHTFFTGEVMA